MITALVIVDKTARRSDHHQAGDRAGAETEHAGFAAHHPFSHRPDKRDASGDRRGREGVGRDPVRAKR